MAEQSIQELKIYMERLEDRILKLEQKKDIVLENKTKNFEDIKTYNNLKIPKLYASLPIFTSVPTYIGTEGEIVFVDDGTYYYLCVYKDSDWRKFGLTYVEATQGATGVGVGNESTWINWDLSDLIPANAKYAEILILNTNDSQQIAGVRKDGSSSDRYHYMANDSQSTMLVELGTTRIVERYSDIASSLSFMPLGYWI